MAFVTSYSALQRSVLQCKPMTARRVRWRRVCPRATLTDVAQQQQTSGEVYRAPPQKILDLVDADLDPVIMLQPLRKKILLMLERPSMPSIAEVSAPELKLAGFRINPTTFCPSRADFALDLKIQLADDPERKQLSIKNFPINEDNKRHLGIGSIGWSPDGSMVAFCTHDPAFGLQLWCMDAEKREAWRVLPENVRLNALSAGPFTWLSDSKTLIVSAVRDEAEPEKDPVPKGPIVEESVQGAAKPNRTYQDLLKNQYDEDMFTHYTTAQLEVVDARTGERRKLGRPAPFRSISPSPDGRYLLVDMMKRPFSYLLPASRFAREVEIWDITTGQVAAEVAEIPLQDTIPLAFDGVTAGPRTMGWRSDADAIMYWVQAQDGGDPNVEAEIRDHVYVLSAPFSGTPRRLLSLEWRFAGMMWGDDETAIAYERRYKTRSIRGYLIKPGAEGASTAAAVDGRCTERAEDAAIDEAPRRLFMDIVNWEDRYSDPGNVLTKATERGRSVIRKIQLPNKPGRLILLMQNPGASEEGDQPYLALMDTEDNSTSTIWQSKPPMYENVVNILETDEHTGAPTSLLIKRETPTENPQLYKCKLSGEPWSEQKKDILHAITNFPHPSLQLKDVQRKIVTYLREDGVKLNANLYLPVGYDKERDGPLKMFMWAYPREFKSADFAGQMRDSPHRFVRLIRTPLYWLALGYAILDGPAMPVIGEGDTEPNDTYIEQLVSSAKAAVDFVVGEGIARRDQIAIGGHSYGAFMTVCLLAHAPELFCCGIARSGAYNRTLTPFGFQAEERTLWDAPDIYRNMSPYLAADRIQKPLLLIHGDADNNPGTFPLQSERLFQALKGLGKRARYVLLPAEGHGYSARESILHVLAEMTEWLEKHCDKEAQPKAKL